MNDLPTNPIRNITMASPSTCLIILFYLCNHTAVGIRKPPSLYRAMILYCLQINIIQGNWHTYATAETKSNLKYIFFIGFIFFFFFSSFFFGRKNYTCNALLLVICTIYKFKVRFFSLYKNVPERHNW